MVYSRSMVTIHFINEEYNENKMIFHFLMIGRYISLLKLIKYNKLKG